MCIKHLIVKKILTLILMCTILNVVCDFSAFNFGSHRTSSGNVDLDNTYLESLLESLFHKEIRLGNKASGHNQSSSTSLSKLCSVVAFHDQPVMYLPLKESAVKNNFIPYLKQFQTGSFIEINSPPPKA